MATQDDVRSDLLELADWIEAAMGPSLDLDNAIRDLVGEPRETGGSTPRYSQSLDAAMTLVPEGWCEGYQRYFGGMVRATCSPPDNGEFVIGLGATPALALTAAALRAQSTKGRE